MEEDEEKETEECGASWAVPSPLALSSHAGGSDADYWSSSSEENEEAPAQGGRALMFLARRRLRRAPTPSPPGSPAQRRTGERRARRLRRHNRLTVAAAAGLCDVPDDVLRLVAGFLPLQSAVALMRGSRLLRRALDTDRTWRMLSAAARWGPAAPPPPGTPWKEVYRREHEGHFRPLLDLIDHPISVRLLGTRLVSADTLEVLRPPPRVLSLCKESETLRAQLSAKQEITAMRVNFYRQLWVFPMLLLPLWVAVLCCETLFAFDFNYPYFRSYLPSRRAAGPPLSPGDTTFPSSAALVMAQFVHGTVRYYSDAAWRAQLWLASLDAASRVWPFFVYVAASSVWSSQRHPARFRREVWWWRIWGMTFTSLVHEILFRYLLLCATMVLVRGLDYAVEAGGLVLAACGVILAARSLADGRGAGAPLLLANILWFAFHVAFDAVPLAVRFAAAVFHMVTFGIHRDTVGGPGMRVFCASLAVLVVIELFVTHARRRHSVRDENALWTAARSLVNSHFYIYVLLHWGGWHVMLFKGLEWAVIHTVEAVVAHLPCFSPKLVAEDVAARALCRSGR